MTTQLDTIAERLPSTRLGQGTAVEQSRAIAEVQAAIFVARQFPRNINQAIEAMRDSCRRKELAEHAFYRYPKGGGTVTGPTIKLARELARVWGNFQYGLTELRRDDDYGQSEMLAFAWDVQTNTRNSSVVINPHKLYTGGGGKQLTELRDIYDNNANVGARRVREAIFAVLPTWFVEEAVNLCSKTLADGGGVPLPQRIANAIEVFGNMGISVPQLEAKLGTPNDRWTDQDVAQLRIIRQSLMRGEIRKEDEFPAAAERVSAAEITGQKQQEEKPRRSRRAPQNASPVDSRPPTPPADDETAGEAQHEPDARPPAKASTGQVGIIQKLWRDLGYDDADPAQREERLTWTAQLAGLDELATTSDLTQEQAALVRERLKPCGTRADVVELITGGGNG
jgi:hypothetical protein